MSTLAIRVENLSKLYKIGARRNRHDTLGDHLAHGFKSLFSRNGRSPSQPPDTFWALKDLSFDVRHGEVLGIIGRNGAGKSTLLKILSRITLPTEGHGEIYGRVGSLLEVGTGFHPELTGRENIYLNGAILGMRKFDIERRFDEIVEFAEIGKFLDTPVKRYSSGMYVRLAFAVAAHLEPEIMIVDEVLAVGDTAFQRKCLGKMEDVAKEGRTILFVSHNMTAVQGLCQRAVLLKGGSVIEDGKCSDVVDRYFALYLNAPQSLPIKERKDRLGSGRIKVTGLRFGTKNNREGGFWKTGEDSFVELAYECSDDEAYKNVEVAVGIRRPDQSPLLYLGTKVVRQGADSVSGFGSFSCFISRLPLEPGQYSVVVELKQNGILSDYIQGAATVEVLGGDYYGTGVIWPYGGLLCDYSWSHMPSGSSLEDSPSQSRS